MTNTLYYGDNLHVLREHVKDESVDLVYLDPPFNSNANYNILFKSPEGHNSDAQIEAFEDTWHWNATAEQAFDEVMRSGNTAAFELLRAMRAFLGDNDMMAYLAMMAVRLLELHRVLKPTGSLYLHCDPTASHYLKLLLDGVFGATNYRAEIVWGRTNARSTQGKWPRIHDLIFQYSKTEKFKFKPQKAKSLKTKAPHTLIKRPDGLKYNPVYPLDACVRIMCYSPQPKGGAFMLKLNAHARIEIALVAILLLGSCDSLPANYTRGDDEKLEMADANARNAINRVNSLESRVSDIEQRLNM